MLGVDECVPVLGLRGMSSHWFRGACAGLRGVVPVPVSEGFVPPCWVLRGVLGLELRVSVLGLGMACVRVGFWEVCVLF